VLGAGARLAHKPSTNARVVKDPLGARHALQLLALLVMEIHVVWLAAWHQLVPAENRGAA
jgi:hypothetical protein